MYRAKAKIPNYESDPDCFPEEYENASSVPYVHEYYFQMLQDGELSKVEVTYEDGSFYVVAEAEEQWHLEKAARGSLVHPDNFEFILEAKPITVKIKAAQEKGQANQG